MSSISEIRVNTDELRANADVLKGVNSELAQLLSDLLSSIGSISAGKYEGQLDAIVSGLASQARNGGGNLQVELEKLANELTARAWAFDSANIPRGQGISASLGSRDRFGNLALLALFAGLASLQIGVANRVFEILGFGRDMASRFTTVVPPGSPTVGKAVTSNTFAQLSLNKKLEKFDSVSNEIEGLKKSGTSDVQKLKELESQKNLLQQAIDAEKPQPHELVDDIDPSNYSSCALYAQNRRSDLGTTAAHLVDQGYSNEAAANYKNISGSFELSGRTDTADLRSLIAPGYAIVWDKGAGMNPTYGHVAIIEQVYKDRIVVSQANYSGGDEFTTTQISKEGVFIVP